MKRFTIKILATGQVFELTPSQEAYLRSNGVDQFVIDQMPQVNRDVRNSLLGRQSTGTPPAGAPVYQQAPAYSAPAQAPPAYTTPAQPAPVPAPAPPPANPYLNTPVPPPPGQ